MESAKQAVSSFISRDGKHKTTAEETVAPAVTQEAVRPEHHEQITTAIDKEVHQDHHHTTIQPIKAKEVLAEQHSHNIAAVEHKTFDHRNDVETRDTLERERAKFRDTSVTHDTRHTTSAAPTVEGERIHHHVHEHIQPVIQKEVIAPKVVHTTIPIHETHHAEAVHHGTSVLPTKTLDEFRSGKGILDGRENHSIGEYEGCPKPYRKEFQQETLDGDKDMHLHGPGHHEHSHSHGDSHRGENLSGSRGTGIGGSSTTTSGPHKSNLLNKADPRVDSDRDGRDGRGTRTGGGLGSSGVSSGTTGTTGTTGTGGIGQGIGSSGGRGNLNTAGANTNQNYDLTDRSGAGARTGGTGGLTGTGTTHGSSNTTTGSSTTDPAAKPSLLDRLNPLKDTDHDGKKGFLD